jgi:hypothetical protein
MPENNLQIGLPTFGTSVENRKELPEERVFDASF